MMYRCIAMVAQVTEDPAVTLYDYEFEGTDGSSLMLANSRYDRYELNYMYEFSMTKFVVELPTKETE